MKRSWPAWGVFGGDHLADVYLLRDDALADEGNGTVKPVTVVLRQTRRASNPMDRHTRVGAAARRRVRQGGPIAKGRPALSRAGYETLRGMLLTRATRGCERCASDRITGELEHCVDRGDGGADSWDNCWVPCPGCRDAKVAPYRDGRLVVEAVGGGRFKFQTWIGDDKRSAFPVGEPTYGGRWATPEEAEILATVR